MFPLPIVIFLIVILALVSFLLSASETSIIGLSRIRLRHMLSRGVKGSKHVQHLISRLDRFIVGILVLNNFVNIALSSIVTAICVSIFGFRPGIIVATFMTAFFILILCEITPKILAIKYTERVAVLVAPVMELAIKLFSPVISFFNGASNFIIRMIRLKPVKRSPLITEEELRLMIELGKEEGFLSDEEGRMLQQIFEFGDIKVADVMIPKHQIVAVDINTNSEQLLNIFVEQGHARLPVYSGTPENIVGIVYSHDLLYLLRDKGLFLLQDLLHEPYFVLSKMPVSELLKKFQEDKLQIAIVTDEHRKTLGLVTLEDLLEEIVGEIEEKPGRRHSAKKK